MKIALKTFPFVLLLITCIITGFKKKQANEKAPTPPMGWNSWNWFGKKKINEQVVHEVIDAMAEHGLREAGYLYVVVDGGWRATTLAPNGMLLADTVKFPHGIKALADYAHSKRLKFGLHIVPGTADCIGDKVGGFGHEEIQMQQFIDWGIDFLKIDKCKFQDGWNEALLKDTYTKWSSLIAKMAPHIVLSISAYQFRDWYPSVGQMGRTTDDISTTAGGMSGYKAVFDDSIPKETNKWDLLTVMQVAEENNKWAAKAGHGYWNDPDMLVTGEQGLSVEEQKSHFALWCIMSSPLMLGDDPRNMTTAEKNIVLNKDCIAIDQDPTEQGKRVKKNGSTEIWIKKLKNGDAAVLLLNRDKTKARDISLDFPETGLQGKITVRDIYSKTTAGIFSGGYKANVLPKTSMFILLSPVKK
jgi:alpha-galactosidase